MLIFPKIEKVTRDLTVSHFLVMFGYRLFSLYFPLFLVARGMELPQVGYAYLLIYLPIALFAPAVGILSHKINPHLLASIGILGYGVYALGMILIKNLILFYIWQVLLGISAALFFVSARTILISSQLENYNRAFGWFYSAPFYADAFAPAIGAFFIWKFNFVGVFILSLITQILTALFFFFQVGKKKIARTNLQAFQENYKKAFIKLKEGGILLFLFISFSVLVLEGFYRAFFVLFLKDSLSWSRDLILFFGSISSFLFLPISLLIIRYLEKSKSEKSIFAGGMMVGVFSILFGILIPFLNFISVLLFELGRSAGSLICNSGRSSLISRKLKEIFREAGAIDTIFSPLGVALGALISGKIVDLFGYQFLFIFGGIFVLISGILIKYKFRKIVENSRVK